MSILSYKYTLLDVLHVRRQLYQLLFVSALLMETC